MEHLNDENVKGDIGKEESYKTFFCRADGWA